MKGLQVPKSFRGRAVTWLILALSLAPSIALFGAPTVSGAIEPREIHIVAHQYAFDPERLFVRAGEVIILKLTTSDVAHGFYLDGYGIEKEIVPGEEVVIQFTADKVGKFSYRCSVTCGVYHPYMKGELVVESSYGNLPFLASISLALGVAAFTVAYVHKRGMKPANP